MSNRSASTMRGIRAELPPSAGQRWCLDVDHCTAELATRHALFSVRRYPLHVLSGSLAGSTDGQMELSFALICQDTGMDVRFRSTSFSRPETFRYLAKGELTDGVHAVISVIRIHDLSWLAARARDKERRILTLSAAIDGELGNSPRNRGGWLMREAPEVFMHTEWLLQPAAA